MRRRITFGWVVAAWAAVVAQAVPAVCRGDCGRPRCSEQADCRDPAAAGAPADSGGCPLCVAAPSATAGAQPSDASDEPCRCHLDARQDQPLAPSKGSLLDLVADDLQAALGLAPAAAPRGGSPQAGCPNRDCCGCCETGICMCTTCTCECCIEGCCSDECQAAGVQAERADGCGSGCCGA